MSEQKQEISSSFSPQLKAEAGLKRVFNVEQKSYYEKLKAEMAAIARNRTPRQMHAEKDRESLRAWVERKRKIIKFLEDKIIPEQEREVEEVEIDISNYSKVEPPVDSGGRLAFAAMKAGSWIVVTDKGEELGEREKYEGDDKKPVVIGGRIAFAAKKLVSDSVVIGFQEVIVFEDGTEIGERKDYIDIGGLTEVDGQAAFYAEKIDIDKKMIAVVAGKKFDDDYRDIYFFKKIEAGVAFIAEKGKDHSRVFVKIMNGEKNETEINIERGKETRGFWIAGGQVKIMVEDIQCRHGQDKRFFYVDETGTPVSDMYKGVTAPKIVNGRFIFKARKCVETSTPTTQGYKYVDVIVEDGKEVICGRLEGDILHIYSVDDQTYLVRMKVMNEQGMAALTEVLVKEDGKIIGKDKNYVNVDEPVMAGGQIVFRALRKGEEDRYILAKENGEEIKLDQYTTIFDLLCVGDRVIYTAGLGGKFVVADELGREVSGRFDKIYFVKPCGEDRFYVVAKDGEKIVRRVYELLPPLE